MLYKTCTNPYSFMNVWVLSVLLSSEHSAPFLSAFTTGYCPNRLQEATFHESHVNIQQESQRALYYTTSKAIDDKTIATKQENET
jgi:hypothetical protein